MGIVDYFIQSLSTGRFWLGMFTCCVLSILIKIHKTGKRKDHIWRSRIYDDIFERMDKGETIDLEAEFSKFRSRKKPEPIRYLAWKYLIYWIASKYASYDYSCDTATRTHKHAAVLFGENSMAYSKLVAADEVFNRSTRFILDEHKNTYHNRDVSEFKELFNLADLIIESMYPENY